MNSKARSSLSQAIALQYRRCFFGFSAHRNRHGTDNSYRGFSGKRGELVYAYYRKDICNILFNLKNLHFVLPTMMKWLSVLEVWDYTVLCYYTIQYCMLYKVRHIFHFFKEFSFSYDWHTHWQLMFIEYRVTG